jgi:cysteinyl-tRNA synthetase
MALRLLGEAPIDIHAGGVDLIFPHHENEIAQSEGATGKTFARCWVHVEHLMIEESSGKTDKMSKSLGNVYNLQDIIDQGFRPSALRYLYLGVHYRKQLRFSWSAMEQAEESLRRLTDFLARSDGLAALPARPVHATIPARLAEAEKDFGAHIAADLNTSGALSVLFDLVRELNTAMDAGELGAADAPAIRATFARFDEVLGVLALRTAEDEHPPVPVEEIERLIGARREARLARNFAEADRIRKDLEGRGIILEDTGSVTRWKKK